MHLSKAGQPDYKLADHTPSFLGKNANYYCNVCAVQTSGRFSLARLTMATLELEEVEGHFACRKKEHGRGTKYNRYPE